MNIKLKLNDEITIKDAIDKILKWNNNKNLVLWPLYIDKYNIHKDIISPFGNMTYIDLYKFVYFDKDLKYKSFIKDNTNYNIFLSILYLEDFKNNETEYLIIKTGNLKDIFPNWINKDILIFELHLNNMTFNANTILWQNNINKYISEIYKNDD